MKRTNVLICMVTLFALALLAGTGDAATIPVANPSFEAPDVGDGGWSGSATGWTVLDPVRLPYMVYDPVDSHFTGTTGDNANGVLPDGGQVYNSWGSDSTVWQDVGPTLASTSYTLTFYHGTSIRVPTNTLTAELLDNGVVFATYTSTAPAPDTFVQRTLVGTTGSTVNGNLSIRFSSPDLEPMGSAWLDMVALEATLVPEPSTFVLVTLGLAGLGFVGRRRRR